MAKFSSFPFPQLLMSPFLDCFTSFVTSPRLGCRNRWTEKKQTRFHTKTNTNMQLIESKRDKMTTGLFLVALTLLTLSRPALADDLVSFKGKEASVSSTPVSFVFPLSTSQVVAEGRLTHFGHYTLSSITVINVLLASATGTSTMTFRNGDMLFLTLTGHALQPFSLKETIANFTVTGGTGRFAGVTGGWTTDSYFAFPVNAGVTVNPYTALLNGQFSFPDSCDEEQE
jgi:hypothetical protein